MILSQLGLEDLTRTLSVSKSWQHTILGAIELRRNLFLAPKEPHEFLRWEQGEPEWEPRIDRDIISGGRPIVQVHPVLQPDLRARTCLYMRQHYDLLKTVSPSTFLTQPPVTEVLIDQKISNAHFERTLKLDLRCEVGVTFGEVIEELEVLYERETSGGRTGRYRSSSTDRDFRTAPICGGSRLPFDRHDTKIEAAGVIAEGSDCVRAAREVLEQKRQSSEPRGSSPEVNVEDRDSVRRSQAAAREKAARARDMMGLGWLGTHERRVVRDKTQDWCW